jgi:hypothetical protein
MNLFVHLKQYIIAIVLFVLSLTATSAFGYVRLNLGYYGLSNGTYVDPPVPS